MFFPGETVSHSFVLPFVRDEISQIVISYKQNGKIIFEKIINNKKASDTNATEGETNNDDSTVEFIEDGPYTTIAFSFSQTESLLFEDESPFTAQINVHCVDGTRHTSHECNSSSGIQYLREITPTGG